MKPMLIYLVLCALSMVACSGPDNSAEQAQLQVDSIVAAKTAAIELQLQRSNDSIINAMALARADSAMGKPASVKKDTAAVR